MIASAAAWLISHGVPLRFARPLLLVAALLVVAALVGTAWRCSVSGGVERREAEQRAANAERARAADQGNAAQARADDARNQAEGRQLERTVSNEPTPLSDRDRAYLRCVRLQQHARAVGQPVPAC